MKCKKKKKVRVCLTTFDLLHPQCVKNRYQQPALLPVLDHTHQITHPRAILPPINCVGLFPSVRFVNYILNWPLFVMLGSIFLKLLKIEEAALGVQS